MMRLAFGAKFSIGIAPNVLSDASVAAANNRSFTSDASATVPIPVAIRPKNWRRVTSDCHSRSCSLQLHALMGSPFRNSFIEIQNRICYDRPRGQLGGIELLIARRFADAHQ